MAIEVDALNAPLLALLILRHSLRTLGHSQPTFALFEVFRSCVKWYSKITKLQEETSAVALVKLQRASLVIEVSGKILNCQC
eukprot:scaffold101185_cov32-Tisochrysis_lutea.AAC.1